MITKESRYLTSAAPHSNPVTDGNDEKALQVFAILREHSHLTAGEIVDASKGHLSDGGIFTLLNRLHRDGLVHRIKGGAVDPAIGIRRWRYFL